MEALINLKDCVFSKSTNGIGRLQMRPFNIKTDLEIIYHWVTHSHAKYWGMQNYTMKQVYVAYNKILKSIDYDVFIGVHNNSPVFLMEKYKANYDRIANYYDAKDSDYGMHLLIAPPEKKIHGFTKEIFLMVMDYFFSFTSINRVVVEPDIDNKKIHVLNEKAGFNYIKTIQLPEKVAALAICSRKEYENAKPNFKITKTK